MALQKHYCVLPDPKQRKVILYWDLGLYIRKISDLNKQVTLCRQSIPFPCHHCDAEIDIQKLAGEKHTVVIAIAIRLPASLPLAQATRHLEGAGFIDRRVPRVPKL